MGEELRAALSSSTYERISRIETPAPMHSELPQLMPDSRLKITLEGLQPRTAPFP